jgi:hypothetical protein
MMARSLEGGRGVPATVENGAENVDKWKSSAGKRRQLAVELRKILSNETYYAPNSGHIGLLSCFCPNE